MKREINFELTALDRYGTHEPHTYATEDFMAKITGNLKNIFKGWRGEHAAHFQACK